MTRDIPEEVDRLWSRPHNKIISGSAPFPKIAPLSNAEGSYNFPAIPVGTFEVAVQDQEGNRVVTQSVEVKIGEASRVDFILPSQEAERTGHAEGTPGQSPVPGGDIPSRLGELFRIEIDRKTSVEGVGLDVEFIDVTEDSRCPTSVSCIWARQATALIGLVNTETGEDLGEGQLTIGAADAMSAGQTFGPYRVEILELDLAV